MNTIEAYRDLSDAELEAVNGATGNVRVAAVCAAINYLAEIARREPQGGCARFCSNGGNGGL
jgi:hypothetical protein